MARALFDEHGVLLYCSTVGSFVRPKEIAIIDHGVLWGYCPCCDKYLGTGAAYDPAQPQPHVGRLPWTR